MLHIKSLKLLLFLSGIWRDIQEVSKSVKRQRNHLEQSSLMRRGKRVAREERYCLQSIRSAPGQSNFQSFYAASISSQAELTPGNLSASSCVSSLFTHFPATSRVIPFSRPHALSHLCVSFHALPSG